MISRRRLLDGAVAAGLASAFVAFSAFATMPNGVFADVKAISLSFTSVGDPEFWSLFDLQLASAIAAARLKNGINSIPARIPVAISTSAQTTPPDVPDKNILHAIVSLTIEARDVKGTRVLVGSIGIALRRDHFSMHMEESAPVLFVTSLIETEVQASVEKALEQCLISGLLEPMVQVISPAK